MIESNYPRPDDRGRRRGVRNPNYIRPAGSVWIDEHRRELPENVWVASDGSGLVASDSSINGLMDTLESITSDLSRISISYNSRDFV